MTSRSTSRSHHRGDFDENSPRPPVPGEETVYPFKSCSEQPGFGYGPDVRCRSSSLCHDGTRTPPACIVWAKNLHCLLADTEGVELFRMYLEQEGRAHADALNFWFACEGLKKQTDSDRISQLVKVIYRKFVTSGQLGIREDLRKEVTSRIRENVIDKGIFDEVQNDIGLRINHTTYPNFLKSDIYLKYVQQLPQDSSSGSGSGSSSSSGGRDPSLCGAGAPLPTLHEDSELVVAPEPLPLTRDMLAATQGRRAFDSRPRPEAFAGVYLQNGPQLGCPRAYSSYNPVSRQDSELQSLSSDARTDSDALSCTDSSLDGASVSQSKLSTKRYFQRQARAIKESAHINRDFTPYLIPRTQRTNAVPSSLKPEEFVSVLCQKLEMVRLQQESQEQLEARLAVTASVDHSRSLAEVIRDKLQSEKEVDTDQDILDQHVSRVWADRTPCRSPGRPKSPDSRRKGPPHPYQARYPPRYQRKDKDLFSTFSSDSGNVHDFPDCSDGPDSNRHFPKSKSVPECVDSGQESRMRAGPRRGSSKRTVGELTDSGVSVVSDSVPAPYNLGKDTKFVESWLKDSDRHKTAKNSMQAGRSVRRERSGSLERTFLQPFGADSMLPPLPSHTATQLEEARRRLIEDDSRGRLSGRQRGSKGNAMSPDVSVSNQSTLKKPAGGRGRDSRTEDYTTVMFSFCEEQFPYRTKLLGRHITLRQFKEILPKKGNYRYYFKTECEEEAAVIQQEVTEDNELVPLFEGKLIAQVKPLE